MPNRRKKLDNDRLHPMKCRGRDQDVAIMAAKLKANPVLIQRSHLGRQTALHRAIMHNHFRCVNFLLGQGANPDGLNRANCSALERAVDVQNLVGLKLLLMHGADPNLGVAQHPNRKTSLLEAAIMKKWPDGVKALVSMGAITEDINFLIHASRRREPPLSPAKVAITSNNSQCLKIVLLHGAALEGKYLRSLSSDYYNLLSYVIHNFYSESEDEKVYDQSIIMLNLLQNFGKNLYDNKDCALGQINVRSPRYTANVKRFMNKYREMIRTPRSLASMARLTIMNAMKPNYAEKVPALNLPDTLQEYLMFERP